MEGLKGKRARGIILYTLCIYISMWLQASVHSAIGNYQTELIGAFALRESQKGLPSSTVSLFTICTFVLVMFLTGRVKKLHILTCGLILGGAALSLIKALNVTSFPLMLVLLAFTGISLGAIDSLASAVISELYPGSGALMCLLHATYGLAGLAMPFAFNLMGAWRTAFASVGLGMLLLFSVMLVISLTRSKDIENKPTKDMRVSCAMVKDMLSRRELLPIFISSILGGMYLNTMLVWTPRFIEFGHDSAKYGAWALPCVYLALTAARLIMSFVKPNMLKALKVMMPFAALFLVAAILVKSPLLALIFVFVSVFCYGPVIPFQLTIAGELLPQNRFILTVSLMFVMMLGQTLIAPVIGAAESAWGISAALYIAAGTMLFSWLAALAIKSHD